MSFVRARWALIALAVGWTCGAQSQEAAPGPALRLTPEQIRVAGIRVAAARGADATRDKSSSGMQLDGRVVLPGDHPGTVLSAVTGQLEAQFVQVGQAVRPGMPLLRIHRAELATLQREYLHAHAATTLAESRVKRDETLFKEGIIAQARLNETHAAYQMAIATEQEQRRALLLAGYSEQEVQALRPESISATLTVQARVAGVVTEQPLRAGQHIEVGTVLLRLAGPGPWWIDLQASNTQVRDLSLGDAVSVPGCRQPGRVIAIGSQVDPASQTVVVRAEVPEAEKCLRLNQYVQTNISKGSVPAGWVSVPASAVVRHGAREFVFVKDAERFRPVEISVARRDGTNAWLSAGVAAGPEVAVSGTAALKGAWLGLGAQAQGQP